MRFLQIQNFVLDDETAVVHGIITKDGLFEGTISTHLEDYHVEPLNRYFPNNITDHSPRYHSIIYKSSDVHDPRKGLPCKSHLLHTKHQEEEEGGHKHRTRRWLLEAEAKLPYDDITFWHKSKPPQRPALVPPFDLNNPYNQPIDEEMDVPISNRSMAADLTAGIIFRYVFLSFLYVTNKCGN